VHNTEQPKTHYFSQLMTKAQKGVIQRNKNKIFC